jgi:hypothetical protein
MSTLWSRNRGGTSMVKKLLGILLAALLATAVVGCDDAPGEDEIGDGEINDKE